MKRSQKKKHFTKVKEEWIKFYKNEWENPDYPEGEPQTNQHYEKFGDMMVSVIKKHGTADNSLWGDIIPRGTEDRIWYRLFQKIEECSNDDKYPYEYEGSKVNMRVCDGASEMYMLLDLYKSGWVDKYNILKMIDWNKPKRFS